MADPITVSSALRSGASALLKAAPWLWKQLPRNTPIGRAIGQASERFKTRLPSFDKVLESWVQSDAFQSQVQSIDEGAVIESDIAHAELFVQTTGFGLTSHGLDLVLEALVYFYSELYLQLCEGEHGMRVLGAQVAAIHEELIEQRRSRSDSNLEPIPLRPRLELDSSVGASNAQDGAAESQLNAVKALVDRRQARAGLDLLSLLQTQVDKGLVSSATRYRFHLNKGVCYVLLGKWDDAERQFLLAQAIDPVNRKTLVNLAQIAILKRDFEQGLIEAERILAADPNDSCGNSFMLACLHELGRDGEIAS
ncbi:MAG TPA: hypothetical protein VH640_18830, partial [Bryobacteraceae bacterium]